MCPEFQPPGPRNRVHGRESASRADTQELLTCYEYMRAKYGRPPSPPPPYWDWHGGTSEGVAATPGSAPEQANATAMNNSSTYNTTWANASETGAAQLEEQRSDGGRRRRSLGESAIGRALTDDTDDGARGDPSVDARGGEILATEFVAMPPVDPSASSRLRTLASAASADSAYAWRGGGSGPTWARGSSASQPLHATSSSAKTTLHAPTDAGAAEDAGAAAAARRVLGRAGRRMQQADAETKAYLLTLPHWQLTNAEKVSIVPAWQRRLLNVAEAERDDSFLLVQAYLRALYGESVCNATYGCNLIYGRCVNTTGGDVYEYDQNGTCTCHSWFTGGDCSVVQVIEGETCEYDSLGGRVTLERDRCESIRRKLYLCSSVASSDGMPRRCIDDGLTALQCLEAGFMRDEAAAIRASEGVADQASSGSASSQPPSNPPANAPPPPPASRSVSQLNHAGRTSSDWLVAAARSARSAACTGDSIDGTTAEGQLAFELLDCSRLSNNGGDGADQVSGPGVPSASSDDANTDSAAESFPYVANLEGFPEDGCTHQQQAELRIQLQMPEPA